MKRHRLVNGTGCGWRAALACVAAGGWILGGGGLATRALAQRPTATIQPFEDGTPAPSPTPRRTKVRRAQPVSPDGGASPTDPPVARAVPVDPAAATDTANRNDPDASALGVKRRDRRTPTAVPDVTPARSNYPAPGSGGDNGPDEPVDPTPRVDEAAPATRSATSAAADDDHPRRPAAAPVAAAPVAPDDAPPGATRPTVAPRNGDDDTNGDDIRIAPQTGQPVTSPEETQYNLASRHYRAKDYTQAAADYERYLGQFPDGKQRQAAMWWLGESYRFLKRTAAARSSYQNLTISFQDGEFVGPASFRLATIDYEARDYQTALGLFRKAADLSKAQDVILYSRYSEALCLEQLGRKDETKEVYDNILSFGNDNPYRDDAHLKLAELAMGEHHSNEAFKQYEALAHDAAKPALQADSALKAGILAHEIGQDDTASTLLTRAISLPGATATVRGDAMIAQLHLLYDTNKYKELLAAYPSMRPALPTAVQPEAMLMAANADRQLGRHQEARAVYDELITQYSNTPQAPEARYQRIISLYAADDPNFPKEADDFLLVSSDPTKSDEVRLMKADTFFKRRDYVNAALAYSTLDSSFNLPPKYKAEALYRLGYSEAQAHQPEKTVAAFSRFLRDFPDHPFVAKALMQRGAAYQQLKKYDAALQDFTEVANNHKDAKEREVAMTQRALILGAQNDPKGMIEAFRALLKEYPNTGPDVTALAHYSMANAAFNDLKDYTTAQAEFDAARKADPKGYGPKCSLMVILCEYQLKDKAKLAADVDAYEKTKPVTPVPPTILGWLGQQEYDDKNYAAAEPHLTAAAASPGSTPDLFLALARTRVGLNKWDGALESAQKYLAAVANDPDERAQGLLVQAEAQVGLKQYDPAQKAIDETLYIQPEGRLNARALILRGKCESAQGKYADAAKSYASVALLYDDEEVTPQALRLAAEAYEKAGQPAEAAKAREDLKTRFPNFTTAKVP